MPRRPAGRCLLHVRHKTEVCLSRRNSPALPAPSSEVDTCSDFSSGRRCGRLAFRQGDRDGTVALGANRTRASARSALEEQTEAADPPTPFRRRPASWSWSGDPAVPRSPRALQQPCRPNGGDRVGIGLTAYALGAHRRWWSSMSSRPVTPLNAVQQRSPTGEGLAVDRAAATRTWSTPRGGAGSSRSIKESERRR
jgi:hypothetical protein